MRFFLFRLRASEAQLVAVTDSLMAVDALHRVRVRVDRATGQVVDQVVVAMNAALLQDGSVLWRNLDRFVKVLQREGDRVMPTILALSEVLADEIVGKVAVYASSDCVMTGLLPRVILRLHDVAVDANLGGVTHVRKAFGILEGEQPNAEAHTDHQAQYPNRVTHKRHLLSSLDL